jgi:molybdenum cofactor biosynthesis enzyme MoaA
MSAKEKAVELIEKYKDYVHGYVGSSMLTNHEYPEQILSQAKKCALIAVELKLDGMEQDSFRSESQFDYWQQVKQELTSA